jgi:DNA (cytosine-5)-methyltransferase 1
LVALVVQAVRPRILDLFCGAGGAAMGYHRAGFDVIGVDIVLQLNYPFQFMRADVLLDWHDILWEAGRVDTIHASPPCQAHSSMQHMWNAGEHPDLVASTRDLLIATGLPYVIENVVGAPLIDPVKICGASMGLRAGRYDIARHRLFETNFPVMVPPCAHGSRPVLGIYGDNSPLYQRRNGTEGRTYDARLPVAEGIPLAREVMGIDWMTWKELTQAIPPAYTELIGHQLLQHIRARAA